MAAVVLRLAAESIVREAHDWYEEREPGLGTAFIRTVDAGVPNIRQYPRIYPVVYKQARQGVLRRFPYSVLDLVEGDSIILSVSRASRDPKLWKRRA